MQDKNKSAADQQFDILFIPLILSPRELPNSRGSRPQQFPSQRAGMLAIPECHFAGDYGGHDAG